MIERIKAKLGEIYKKQGPAILDKPDDVESVLKTACPKCDKEIDILIDVLKKDVKEKLRSFVFRKTVFNKKLLSSLTDSFTKETNYTIEEAEWAIAVWAEVLGATMKVYPPPPEHREKPAIPKDNVQEKDKKVVPFLPLRYLKQAAIVLGVCGIIAIIYFYHGFLSEQITSMWAPQPQPEEPKLTEHDIIEDLKGIAETKELLRKLSEYGPGREHVLSFGAKDDFFSNENDYVFVCDSNNVYGVFQNVQDSLIAIKAETTYDSLKFEQMKSKDLWIHFVKPKENN